MVFAVVLVLALTSVWLWIEVTLAVGGLSSAAPPFVPTRILSAMTAVLIGLLCCRVLSSRDARLSAGIFAPVPLLSKAHLV